MDRPTAQVRARARPDDPGPRRGGGAFLLAVLLAVLAVPLGAQELRSPILDSLRARAAAADTLDTGTFWDEMARRTTPLVEALPETDSVLVTFLWRGSPDTRNALVFGALTGWLPPTNLMERIPRTDVWHLSAPTRPEVRFTYRIAENDNLRIYWRDPDFQERVRRFRPDPLNPDTVPLAGDRTGSHFVGPGFERGPWTEAREPRGGRRDSLVVNDHRARLYLPPEADGAAELGLLLTMDGGAFDTLVSTPATVEALVRNGTIPPVVVVMLEHRDRNAELSPNEGFVRFVADTLLPALQARFPLSPDPRRSVVAGSSLGALAAAYLGYRLPDRFGNVIAQSGAYWWTPPGDDAGGWLFRRFAQGPRKELRIYLDAGTLESQPVRGGVSMLRLTQHLRDVLCAKGYEVAYRTFPGGHEYEHWRATLPGALAWTLGSGNREDRLVLEGEAGGAACRRLEPAYPLGR